MPIIKHTLSTTSDITENNPNHNPDPAAFASSVSEKNRALRLSNQESNRLTKESLQTALLLLMSEKPFDKITITELVKRSGVSRTAFYRNYNTKADILSELGEQMIHEITVSFFSPQYKNNQRQWYIDTFSAVRKHAPYFQLLIQTEFPIYTVLDAGSILEKILPSHSPEEHYRYLLLEGAFINILSHWFRSGMKEDIEFMADFCISNLRFH